MLDYSPLQAQVTPLLWPGNDPSKNMENALGWTTVSCVLVAHTCWDQVLNALSYWSGVCLVNMQAAQCLIAS